MLDALTASPLLLCLGAMALSAASGVLPASPVEPIIVAMAALMPRWMLLPAAALVTLSAMSTKVLVYAGGMQAQRMFPQRTRPRVDALAARLRAQGPNARRSLIVISAMTGVPSFYVVTVLCGTLRMPVREWFIAGTVGRAVRIIGLVFLPTLLAALRRG